MTNSAFSTPPRPSPAIRPAASGNASTRKMWSASGGNYEDRSQLTHIVLHQAGLLPEVASDGSDRHRERILSSTSGRQDEREAEADDVGHVRAVTERDDGELGDDDEATDDGEHEREDGGGLGEGETGGGGDCLCHCCPCSHGRNAW